MVLGYNPLAPAMHSSWLIHNPSAGRFPAQAVVARAADVLRGAGWEVRLETAHGRGEFLSLIRQAIQAKVETVIVAGGDGSVGLAAGEVRGTPVALGAFPTGTSNVWAKDLGVPQIRWGRMRSADRAARALAQGEIRPADLGDANGRSFLLWAGTGLDARVVNRIEPRRRLDKILPTTLYVFHTLQSARNWRGIDLEVTWPGGRASGRYLVGLASNIPSYAGGMLKLSPGARLNDGLLDFWLFKGSNVRDLVIRLLQVLLQRHVGSDGFVHFRSATAEFAAEEPLAMHFDGEPGELSAPVRLSVRRGEIRVLVPSQGADRLFIPDSSTEALKS